MNMWLKADCFKVVGFYPYTSIVQKRICEQSHNYKTEDHDFIEDFGTAIQKQAIDLGVLWDNKVVVEIAAKESNGFFTEESNLFVGYKDGRISIGLSVWQPDHWTKQYNQKFE